jgi:hypothetical protein
LAVKPVPPEFVYHYTNAPGLLGIITSSALWASDVEFLNDAEELTYARTDVLDRLRIVADETASAIDKSNGAEQMRVEMIRNVVAELEKTAETSRSAAYHAYVTCFCESDDLLSQWRGYGGSGGYAIGFRTASFPTDVSDVGPHFTKVSYGLDAARGELEAMIEEATAMPAGFPGATGNVKLMTQVLPRVAAIKHPMTSSFS